MLENVARLRSCIPAARLRERGLCLAEMIARYAKNNLRALLRDISAVEDAPFRRVILHFFNILFGQSQASTHFWRVQVLLGIKEKFGSVFDEAEYDEIRKHANNQVLLLLLYACIPCFCAPTLPVLYCSILRRIA